MKRNSTSFIHKILFFLAVTVFSGVFINAQDLKSRPQGNSLIKLNGTFDVPIETDKNFSQTNPLSAVIADLDADGVNDLIVGHQDSISVQRGDLNAFAPQTQEAWEAIRDLRYLSPFASESRSFGVPFPADFVQTGDFTRDGNLDIISSSRSSDRLVLFEGDGRGNFPVSREIFVGGNVTAMSVSDVNRLDGFADVIVGVGSEVLIFQGLGDISRIEPNRIALSNQVETIAVGQLDATDFADIAVGNGTRISIISGSDGENSVSNLEQNFSVKSLIVGEFVPDRASRQEIAALDDAGTIHIIARGDLDTRPVSQKEQLANQVREMLAKKMPVPQRILRKLTKEDLREPAPVIESDNQTWAEYDRFFGANPNNSVSSNAILTSGKLSNYGEDLIILDSVNKEIVVMPLVFNEETSEKVSYAGRRETVRFSLENSPMAAIPVRLNFDGDKDLLILQSGKTEPTTFLTAPEAAFTVNNAGDQVDANPGNGVCATSGGFCTLRAAIMESNRLAGNDSITINAGLNITLSTGNPDNDGFGENSASEGDLDIFCAINATEDACNLPLNTNVNDLSITGAAGGNTISAGAFTTNGLTTTDRVFDIGFDGVFGGGFGGSTGIEVTMSNLTIQNGNVREDIYTPGAGNFANGGAIRMDGFRTGGGHGALSLTNCTINNNQADHNTGGVFSQFAGITFSTVTVTNNIGKAGPGGGLATLTALTATPLSVSFSTFTGNESRGGTVFGTPATGVGGGGIAAALGDNTGTISSTNFTNNVSHDDGGALRLFNGAVTVGNGTQSGNTSRDDGGAIWGDIDTVGAARFLTLSSVTIRGNTANSDNAGGGDGGGTFRDRGTLNVTNCFIGTVALPNAAVNGGGIAHAYKVTTGATNVTTINIDNGSIQGNNATTNGGGINFNSTNNAAGDPSDLNIGAAASVAIQENNANVHGGGIAPTGGATVALTRAFITGNDADKDNNASGDGGGFYHSNSGGTTTVASTVTFGTGGQGNTGENGGAIHHSVGTLTLNSPAISSNTTDIHAGGLFVSGGTVNVNGVTFAANTSTSGTEVRLTGGTTNFSGTIIIPGEISIAGGTLVAGSSTVNLGEDFHFTSGTFTSGTSTFNFNGGAAQQIYGSVAAGFNNVSVSNASNTVSVNFNANAAALSVAANATLQVSATRSLTVSGTLTNAGTIKGTGIIVNNFTNGANGIVAPGLSPGILSLTGNYTNTGAFNVEIGGTGGAGVNPNGHDQLLSSGFANLGGTLNVTLTNGFTPAPGNTFTIFDAAALNGTFATTNLPNILPNTWNVAYNNANGTVVLSVLAPVAAGVSIAGRVATQNGTGISKARVSLTNSSGTTRTIQTNAFGYYQFEDVEVGASYTVQVVSKRYTFAPRVIEVFDEISGLDFTPEP